MEDVIVFKHVPYCMKHGYYISGVYNEEYDSYYCNLCNRWLEPMCKCGGNDCEFFPNRPVNPN